jgi:hypothetical protein
LRSIQGHLTLIQVQVNLSGAANIHGRKKKKWLCTARQLNRHMHTAQNPFDQIASEMVCHFATCILHRSLFFSPFRRSPVPVVSGRWSLAPKVPGKVKPDPSALVFPNYERLSELRRRLVPPKKNLHHIPSNVWTHAWSIKYRLNK